MIAPQTLFAADHQIGILALSPPGKRRGCVETNSFFPKGDLTRFQNKQKNQITEHSREQGANAGGDPRIRFHQSRYCQAGNEPRDYSADRDPVRNDEMLKIDKCPDDEERNKNPVSDRHWPGEALPDCEEKKRGQQFHRKIAKCDFASAICAAAAEYHPADQRQVLLPRNRLLARWTKRAARLVYRKIARQPVNTDVQKGADCGAKNESKYAEEKLVNRIVHAINQRSTLIC